MIRKVAPDGNCTQDASWIMNDDEKCFDFFIQPYQFSRRRTRSASSNGVQFHWQFADKDSTMLRSRDVYMLMYKKTQEVVLNLSPSEASNLASSDVEGECESEDEREEDERDASKSDSAFFEEKDGDECVFAYARI